MDAVGHLGEPLLETALKLLTQKPGSSKFYFTNFKKSTLKLILKEKSFLPAELLRVRDTQPKNSRGELRHRGPGPYKACNTKPQNASLPIHMANIDPSYCNTFSLSPCVSLSFSFKLLSLNAASTLLSVISLCAWMSVALQPHSLCSG